MPALAKLTQERVLPDMFFVIGVSRTPMTDAEFRSAMRAAVAKFSTDPLHVADLPAGLVSRLFYVSGEFHETATYARLKRVLRRVREGVGMPREPRLLPRHGSIR